MGYNMFGPGLALDKTTMRGIPAVAAQLEDAETGETIQAYSMDDVPEPMAVVTNRYGYFEQFKVSDTVRRLRMRFGSLTLENTAWELIFESEASAEAAQYAAEAAAENVLAAQQAAERAAGLVGAPADLAIAAAINQEDSETRSALVTHFGDGAVAALAGDEGTALAAALGAAVPNKDHPLGANIEALLTASALDPRIAALVANDTSATRAAIQGLNPPGTWADLAPSAGFTIRASSQGYCRVRRERNTFWVAIRDVMATSAGAATMLQLPVSPAFEVPAIFTNDAGATQHSAWISATGQLRATWQANVPYRILLAFPIGGAPA